MKPHHVLILAATLFLGAGLYAAFSTPVGGSGVLAFAASLIALTVPAFFLFRLRRNADPRRAMSHAGVTHLALAACLVTVAVVEFRSAPSPSSAAPQASAVTATKASTGDAVFNVSRPEAESEDPTHTFFAAAFSAGVAILAAITFAFLRACDADEPDEASPSSAA